MTYGYFGEFGGRFVAETLFAPIEELAKAYEAIRLQPSFQKELEHLLKTFVGRPTPLTYAARLSESLGGAKIYLKREDLAHTGAHKINNSIGQMLLARHMGKKRIVAETGAGQHGVATATVAAMMGLECIVYMGKVDAQRQALNVYRMKLLGAQVIEVTHGTQTLKDAINEAMRDWVSNLETTYYLLGSALGPHPYPTIVRDFQAVIGREARAQILEQEKRLPTELVACVGGGSNAIGLFHEFINDTSVTMTGVEAGGRGVETGAHAARFVDGHVGVLHGCKSLLLQDTHGQIRETHSISAGLDYASVGPEHAHLQKTGRASYTAATDNDALDAFHKLSRFEGILPALESSHAIAYAIKRAPQLSKNDILLVNLSGRGDKDIHTVHSQTGGHV